MPLKELSEREGRSIPIFVSVLINIVESKGNLNQNNTILNHFDFFFFFCFAQIGLDAVGIFRTNESKPVEQAAKDAIERGEQPV